MVKQTLGQLISKDFDKKISMFLFGAKYNFNYSVYINHCKGDIKKLHGFLRTQEEKLQLEKWIQGKLCEYNIWKKWDEIYENDKDEDNKEESVVNEKNDEDEDNKEEDNDTQE